MPDILACSSCISKSEKFSYQGNSRFDQNTGRSSQGRNIPIRCRAGPGQGCFQETTNFLKKFKEKLAQSADNYLQSNHTQGGQNVGRLDPDLEKNFRELKSLDFKLQVGPRNRQGLALRLVFKGKIQLVVRVQNRWKVESFAIGSPEESAAQLTPEGKSGQKVFEFLNNQIEKIYKVYGTISDFPLGLLIVLIYMHSSVLFEEKCWCSRQFDFSGKGFGLLVPQFRDMWIRPEFLTHYKHNLCQTQKDLDLN